MSRRYKMKSGNLAVRLLVAQIVFTKKTCCVVHLTLCYAWWCSNIKKVSKKNLKNKLKNEF